MLHTRFTKLVGCSIPIQQAPMGALASVRLATAVAAAGGLGMVTVTGAPPEVIAAQLAQARQQATGPVGAHFFLRFVDPELAAECVAAAARVRVVDFFHGTPDPALVEIFHSFDELEASSKSGFWYVRIKSR